MKRFFSLLFFVAIYSAGQAQGANRSVFNIKEFGARGDGKTVDTRAINDAIDAASRQGGGTVLFPAGTYLSYTIRLKSHISLYLDAGCVVKAADSAGGGRYDDPEPNRWGDRFRYQDFGHSHWRNSLIWGENLEDISILGPGVIDGAALSRGFYRDEGWERIGVDARPFMWEGGANKAIALKQCRNVTFKDFTILRGGHFGILATGVDNFTLDNLRIDTNRDGIDIDACQNVRLSNCTVNSPNDDAICLKSSFALGYARPTKNVTITNCQVSGYDVGTLYDGTFGRKQFSQVPDQEGPTGRIKFGTESNGGFQNITISNCVFDYCRGLALETVDGALLEDVSITNITMRDIVNSPFFLRLGARMRGPDTISVGALRRVLISNVMVYNADSHFSSIISGIPNHYIEDVKFNNIQIYYRPIDSPAVKIQKTVPEYEKAYPEPQKFGVLPSYGFFIRHVKNIAFHNVEVRFLGRETRPAVFAEDVKGLRLNNLRAQKPEKGPLYQFTNVENLLLEGRKRNF